MPINNIIKAKPAIIKMIPRNFAKILKIVIMKSPNVFPIFPAPVLFGSRIYRNQHFKFVRNIFKFFPHFFSIFEMLTGSPVISSFSEVVAAGTTIHRII
jgi:hypothetical protein